MPLPAICSETPGRVNAGAEGRYHEDVLSVFWNGLLIAATTTLWWSSSYDLLLRWPERWSFFMRTNLEATEHPVVLFTSAFVTWRVYGMRSILLWHHMPRHLSCLRVAWLLFRCRNSTVRWAVCKPCGDAALLHFCLTPAVYLKPIGYDSIS